MTPLSWLVKASVVLFIVGMVQVALARRMSAAMRHVIWTLTLVGLLLLPVLAFALPGWTFVQLNARQIVAALPESSSRAPAGAIAGPSDSVSRSGVSLARHWSIVLPAAYAAGVVLLLARLSAQRLAVQRLARRARKVEDRGWRRLLAQSVATIGVRGPVRLLTSGEHAMPAMFGIGRPAILLPLTADGWPEDRRRAVLLHELAHVLRRDCLWQTLAAVACAMYWFHPGVWWIARRMRVERELACDDCVLSAGIGAHDYAGHLLEIAYELPRDSRTGLAVEMADPRQLERRLIALMDATRRRTVPGRATRLGVSALALAVILPISVATTASVPADETGQSSQADDPSEAVSGRWEIRPASSGFVDVRLCHADLFSRSEIAIRELDGLSLEELAGPERSVRVILRRDAGAFTLDGTAERGNGSGTYTFTPAPTFPSDLERLGFEPPSAAMQAQWPGLGSWTHTLALYDIGFDFLHTREQGPSSAWHHIVRTKQLQTQLERMREGLVRRSLSAGGWC